MNLVSSIRAGVILLALMPEAAGAKPIAFSHGTTVMAEYGAGTMKEAQVFYAPKYFLSLGPGYLKLESDIDDRRREIAYVRVNYLAKRWNMESAQANVFVWGSAGQAYVSESNDHSFTGNAGAQIDYETRRVYSSLKTDLYRSADFSHRIDTLQLGLAPYEHDYDTLATWVVVQARRVTGEIQDGTEWALMLRLFKRAGWIEAGVTDDGKLQAMAMINF
ncbi:MAG TPA: hypothetical protein VFS58_07340 [Steroidobacteraceae bacterium]|nr:hypothetical protein [Steroidobacteraceae bacterium]